MKIFVHDFGEWRTSTGDSAVARPTSNHRRQTSATFPWTRKGGRSRAFGADIETDILGAIDSCLALNRGREGSWTQRSFRSSKGRNDMENNSSEQLITTMTDPMEERDVRLGAVMKVTREAVMAEAAKGNDARAALAGTLFVAAVAGNLHAVTRCLDMGIDPNWPRRNGTDVLRDIVGMGDARLEITKLLISRGADPNVGTIPVLRQIQGSAFCDNGKTIAFLRSIKARE